MDKRYQHHLSRQLQNIKPWYVFVVFLIFTTVAIYELRSNNLHMAQLRENVYVADQQNKDVNGALQDLRDYVSHHMNTDLSGGDNSVYPPIQLKYTYDRLIRAKSQQTNDDNARIYTEAQKYCEAKIPSGFSGRYRISCIQDYVRKHNASTTYINPDLYKFDFYTPKWAPDLAGISIVLAFLSLLGFVVMLVLKLIGRTLS